MKKGIKSAAVVESEAQTLETNKAASAAYDVHESNCRGIEDYSSEGNSVNEMEAKVGTGPPGVLA